MATGQCAILSDLHSKPRLVKKASIRYSFKFFLDCNKIYVCAVQNTTQQIKIIVLESGIV